MSCKVHMPAHTVHVLVQWGAKQPHGCTVELEFVSHGGVPILTEASH